MLLDPERVQHDAPHRPLRVSVTAALKHAGELLLPFHCVCSRNTKRLDDHF